MDRFLIYLIFFTLVSGFLGTKACFGALIGMILTQILDRYYKK